MFAQSDAPEGQYRRAAVVSNTETTSVVGRDILARGGSAVDALIATALCEGLTAMQNMGVGGGVMMTIYKRDRGRAYFLDAREAAPLRATRDMFMGDSFMSSTGGASIAVPGELMGYWEAHQRFGILPWRDLFQPVISMCTNGVPINARLGRTFRHSDMGQEILASPTLRQVLAPNGRLPKSGENLKLPVLAQTLSMVANDPAGAAALYDGPLTDSFLRDLESVGSIIGRDDLTRYRANWSEPLTTLMGGGHTLYTAPPPASGAMVAFMMNVLEGQLAVNAEGGILNPFNSLRIAEAFKYAYALRTDLGDPQYTDCTQVLKKAASADYQKMVTKRIYQLNRTRSEPAYYGANYLTSSNPGGTINLVVLAPDGDAVVATSTVNTLFGSLQASPSTGIILNNEMDDFSSPDIVNTFGVPPSRANFIVGGKRPLSSAAPTIIVGPTGDVKMALGAAGGTHITTAVAQIIMNYMWFGMSIKQAVDNPRLHHQLLPMVLKYEEAVPHSVIEELARAGHRVKSMSPHSSATAVANLDGKITAIYDYRRGGSTSGY